jgi:hypothetical protein
MDQDPDPVRARALWRAAHILGGSRALRTYLNVPALLLAAWMSGTEAPPTDVFLKAVDLIVDKQLEGLPR